MDLTYERDAETVLAVTYDVVDPATGNLVYRVGDRPGADPPGLAGADGTDYHRLKLLKASPADAFSHQYALRNVYAFGFRNADPRWSGVAIEARHGVDDSPERDEAGTPYATIFGVGGRDPYAGIVEPLLDLRRGLLFFPAHMERPFDEERAVYEANLGPDQELAWTDSYLAQHRFDALYDWRVPASAREPYGAFTIVVTVPRGSW
jgi:hypothetical protein